LTLLINELVVWAYWV